MPLYLEIRLQSKLLPTCLSISKVKDKFDINNRQIQEGI